MQTDIDEIWRKNPPIVFRVRLLMFAGAYGVFLLLFVEMGLWATVIASGAVGYLGERGLRWATGGYFGEIKEN